MRESPKLRDDVPAWFLDAMSMSPEQVRALEDRETPRELGWREGPNLDAQSDYAWALEHFRSERMDPGIVHVVRTLKDHGIETVQSCQGGDGHAYRYPTVEMWGQPWRALEVCNDYGIPVLSVMHVWGVRDGEPERSVWRLEFAPRKLAQLREQWYAEEARDRAEYLRWAALHSKEQQP